MFSLIPWRKRNGNVKVRTGGAVRRAERHEDLLLRLRDDLAELMDRFFGDRWFSTRFATVPSLMEEPIFDWRWDFGWEDRDNEYVFRAEVPGFEPEDFDIHVSGNVLTIKAERKTESGKKGGEYRYQYGAFRRTATLPYGADANNIEARYHSGVLEVHVPKTAEARGKRVEVKVG